MQSTRQLSRHAREMSPIPIIISGLSGEIVTDLRIFPGPLSDWRLVKVAWEVQVAVGGNPFTIDVKDPSNNAAITQISLATGLTPGNRGTATLSSNLAAQCIHANGGNAYHSIQVSLNGGANGGRVQLLLYYEKEQPSADLSGARL